MSKKQQTVALAEGQEMEEGRQQSFIKETFRRLKKSKSAMIALYVIIFFLIMLDFCRCDRTLFCVHQTGRSESPAGTER